MKPTQIAVTYNLDAELVKRVKIHVAKNGGFVYRFVEQAIREALDVVVAVDGQTE